MLPEQISNCVSSALHILNPIDPPHRTAPHQAEPQQQQEQELKAVCADNQRYYNYAYPVNVANTMQGRDLNL